MPKITDKQIMDALRECKGMVYVAAASIPCSPKTIKARLASKPELAEILREESEAMKDTAEMSLFDAVIAGDPWAVQYYLTRKAKDRGYGDRQETVNLNVNWDDLTDDELKRIAAGESPAVVLADRSAKAA